MFLLCCLCVRFQGFHIAICIETQAVIQNTLSFLLCQTVLFQYVSQLLSQMSLQRATVRNQISIYIITNCNITIDNRQFSSLMVLPQLSSPKGSSTKSARAVSGRQCPQSQWGGEDFLASQTGPDGFGARAVSGKTPIYFLISKFIR